MTRRILLIEDDPGQFRLTQAQFRNFRTERYDLDWAATYEAGMERLVGGGYAACLLDFQLGERDGLQLIREAADRGCRTPIVFLTAESSPAVDIEAMHAGALDYLVKGELTPAALERSLRYAVKLGDTLEALHRLATRDELTGLCNRREFDRILERELERARRFSLPLALALFDVDHFKAINDRHGHPAGDVVLQEVARRLQAQVRSVDWVARFGGEEFAVIAVQADRAGGRIVAERVCAALAAEGFSVPGAPAALTLSAGVAACPADAATAPALVAAADRALYAAKHAGRNRAVCFDAL
jgi:diguanylate cyclase (GGDEF)-like protein